MSTSMIGKVYVDEKSEAYKRVTAAGFTIDRLAVDYVPEKSAYLMSINFTCVCGTQEILVNYFEDYIAGVIDAAKMIEDADALSEDHLREDGYTEDEIKRIRAPYEHQRAVA